MALRVERSIPELLSDALSQLAKLISNEFELARAEMSEKASQAARGVAMIGAGAVILIPALVILLIALALWLTSLGLSEPVAYLVTGVGAVIISAILFGIGISRLSADALKPAVTIEQMRRDKMAAQEMVR